MTDLLTLLARSSSNHKHLCPRQILGVRIGLAGARALGLELPRADKRVVAIIETDGCFADGLIAATGCTIGHRTLRVEDYGKVAASFIDIQTGLAFRVSPSLDCREKVYQYAPDESRHYFAQLRAYPIMPDEELLTVTKVFLNISIEYIINRPGIRTNCDICGEEVINEREIHREGLILCRACAGLAYYGETIVNTSVHV